MKIKLTQKEIEYLRSLFAMLKASPQDCGDDKYISSIYRKLFIKE